MSIRTERVAGEIQQAISNILRNEHSDLFDGLITITKVRMAADLKSGRVYFSLLGGTMKPEAVLAKLKADGPKIRSSIGREVRLKFTPELFYYIDDTEEEASKIDEIFRKINLEKRQRENNEPQAE